MTEEGIIEALREPLDFAVAFYQDRLRDGGRGLEIEALKAILVEEITRRIKVRFSIDEVDEVDEAELFRLVRAMLYERLGQIESEVGIGPQETEDLSKLRIMEQVAELQVYEFGVKIEEHFSRSEFEEAFKSLSNFQEQNPPKIWEMALSVIDFNVQDKQGLNFLMWAAKKGNTEMVKLLIAANADVNVQDNDDRTALMLAAQKGHTKVVMLIEEALRRQAEALSAAGEGDVDASP
jgi:hypothetical protein